MADTIKIGSLDISAFKVGSSDCKIYLGDTLLYPQTTPSLKFTATYSDGTSYSEECDDNSTLTTATTKPSGYTASAMTSAEIGDCVTSLGENAFSGCSSISAITIPSGVTSISNSGFRACSGLTSIELPSSVTEIGSAAFRDCSSLSSVTIPNGVTSITSSAFYRCSGLTSIDIPSGVTSIGSYAFWSCSSLTNIVIPNNVTSINSNAFEHCIGLTSITLSNSITSIQNNAFHNCNHLTSVDLPESVASIGRFAFDTCSRLTSITLRKTDGVVTLQYTNALDNTNNCPIYVPAALVDTYKSATNWSTYSSRIEAIPSPVTLEWQTIPSDGSSVDLNGVKIYGLKGNIDSMTYLFEYTSNINVHYDYNNNCYVVNIGNGCYTNTYNGGNIELVFSELGCSEYYITDASIPSSYFGFQILTEV